MVEHFDGTSLEDILHSIFFKNFFIFSPLFINIKAVKGVKLNLLVDVCSFLDILFDRFFCFVVAVKVVQIENFFVLFICESDNFVVSNAVQQAETINQNKVNFF